MSAAKLLRSVTICSLILNAALARAGEPEALAISANIQTRHNPYGTVLDPVYASAASDQIVGYTRCGDSAIWTGHYLAAEAFRYKVTHAPESLANAIRAIAGIKGLLDVTGTNLLARCLIPANSPYAAGIQSEEAQNGIHVTPDYIWVGNTSRDQYSGVMFGLGVAYDMIDEPGVRASIADIVTRLIDFLRGHNWSVAMPDGSISTTFIGRGDQQLSFLQVGRHVNPSHYSTEYDKDRILLSLEVQVPVSLEVGSDDSYFKFNLDYINLYNLVRLESSSARSLYEKAYDVLRNHTAAHQNAFFNMIDRGLKSPDAARDAETLALLDAWLQRSRRDAIVDLHNAVPVCGEQACQPVPVRLRPPTDFLWQRTPFQLAGGLLGTIETAGIDYILPYWMARFYGVGPAFTVQSAAAANSMVAPESLASLFGANFTGTTAKAEALPLPTSLGGVSVTVRDASGAERPAPLIYVSPGQINFLVPPGTQTGTATFTIAGGAAPLSAGGLVEPVAPALFSMNGNGMGVAAATALRETSPVEVFHCGEDGCAPTPIDVTGAPVFLSLYGTGIRGRSSLANVKVTVNGIGVPVQYAGVQPTFLGLDQVNVQLPAELGGTGEANVLLIADGLTSNAVTINLR